MPLNPLPGDTFDLFHTVFLGDVPMTFALCRECGGPCEFTKLAGLLPGEAEYIASKRKESVKTFRNIHLDGIMVDGEIIDILKCANHCTFIDGETYACGIRQYKPVVCLIYPLYFPDDSDGGVALDITCRLASHPETRDYFLGEGKLLIERFGIPSEWLRRVRRFDQYNYDYKSLIAGRDCGLEEYNVFDIETLLSFRIH